MNLNLHLYEHMSEMEAQLISRHRSWKSKANVTS